MNSNKQLFVSPQIILYSISLMLPMDTLLSWFLLSFTKTSVALVLYAYSENHADKEVFLMVNFLGEAKKWYLNKVLVWFISTFGEKKKCREKSLMLVHI